MVVRRFQRIKSCDSSRAGFTLIELLVVVAIIMVLLSVLLPSLSQARGRAKSVQCLANLKQLGLAFSFYAGDNAGQYPLFNIYGHGKPGFRKQYYPNVLAQYIPVSKWLNEDGGAPDKSNKVWNCPGVTPDLYNWGGGYGTCASIIRSGPDGTSYRPETLQRPGSSVFLIGDCWLPWPMIWNITNTPLYATYLQLYAPQSAGGPDWSRGFEQPVGIESVNGAPAPARHTVGKANVCFYDAHVEEVRYLDMKNNIGGMFSPDAN